MRMNLSSLKQIHLTGVGGISMSAVAKILLAHGMMVSGSDLKANDQTSILNARGAKISIGEDPSFIPEGTELLVYTSAAPETNLERQEAVRRGIPQLTNFQFLGEWFAGKNVVLVTGTHGKSTTTALLGRALIAAGMQTTVLVGSKVPDFEEGNLYLGGSEVVVIEGDEYAKHFLEFKPFGIIINNIELDHTDVYANLEEMVTTFGELIDRIQPNGIIVANMSDMRIQNLLAQKQSILQERHIRLIPFGIQQGWSIEKREVLNGAELASPGFERADVVQALQTVELKSPQDEHVQLNLQIPGEFNAMNACAAFVMAKELGAPTQAVATSLDTFAGIWRRFESLGIKDGIRLFSDYGHHPTAVAQTLKAAHEAFPGKRIILCFQPHHRNRTKQLFFEFEACFDQADALVLCEIYDVAGREAKEDERISSQDFLDVLSRRDAEHGIVRHVSYAPNPKQAVRDAFALCQAGDVLIIMGAGDIDAAARTLI